MQWAASAAGIADWTGRDAPLKTKLCAGANSFQYCSQQLRAMPMRDDRGRAEQEVGTLDAVEDRYYGVEEDED